MSNPMLSESRFEPAEKVLDSEPMTISGTVNKVFLLFVCLLAGCALSVYSLFTNPALAAVMIGGGALIGFILVIATCFNVKIAAYTAAPYALCEGFTLGAISAMFENQWHGIVFQAVFATFAVLFVMLMLYKAKLIRYTQRFQTVLMTSMLSILAIYIIQFVASFFGRGIPGIFSNGPAGIISSLVVIIVASMSLIQDFFAIEMYSENMLPKYYEWFGAMGLMVTLVWLYMAILNLLAKLNSRNN